MNIFWLVLSWLIRFLLFFTVVRNITRNRAYGWATQDYGGMVLIAVILAFSWFSSAGMLRIVMMIFLLGVIVTAVFEGLDNRRAAIISVMVSLSALIALLF